MVCLWRYLDNTRNYPGYHLSADMDGCRLLREKLAQIPGKARIPLDEPDKAVLSVPNNKGGVARLVAGVTLRIESNPELPEGYFAFVEKGQIIVLTCSIQMMAGILRGVGDMEQGKGDYAIRGDGDCRLWFWWQV